MSTQDNPFVQALFLNSAFSEAAAAFGSGRSFSAEGIVGSSQALTAAALASRTDGPMIIVTPSAEIAEQIAEDILMFLPAEISALHKVLLFPAWEQQENASESALAIADQSFGERISVLKQLIGRSDPHLILVASMPALMQPVPTPELLKERTQTLTVNGKVDLNSLRSFLVDGGFHATSAVELPGEFAVRGYILDLFAPDWEQPIRIEFFNDEIESIRRFDLATQRSLETLNNTDLTRLQPHECQGASLLDYFPQTIPIVLIEPAAM